MAEVAKLTQSHADLSAMLGALLAAQADFAIAQRAFQADLARQMEAFTLLSTRMEEFMRTDDEDDEDEEDEEDEDEEDEEPVITGKGKGRAAQ